MSKNRVVITGLGIVSPLGSGVNKFWNALKNGESGIGLIKQFDASEFRCRIAGEIPDYDPLDHFSTKESRNLAKFVQFATVASREAIKNAKLDMDKVDKERVGVLVGSGIGAIRCAEEEYQRYLNKGAKRISPHFIPKIIINEASGQVSIDSGALGPSFCITTACSTATDAIGNAHRMLQYGDADVMIAGGTESATTILGVGGFAALKALTQNNENPKEASRPFDLNRDGFVMAEGAGIVILETLEHALKRGAPIIVEMAGYGRTSDAYHTTAPDPSGTGPTRAMILALKDANLKTNEISYINAHGTSTRLNDKVETLAIKNAFGDDAYKIPVSSTKSMTGHLLGAAGGIEFAAAALAVQNDIIPPTINLTTPDPDCDLDFVPNEARQTKITSAMSNSLGFGGHNSSVIVKKFAE